ncbi:hypothetical protein BCR33DRAFT_782195 [Rhizoclosmatium globosum]|uniref:Helix-turn-helix domain-containing protein n=1 Tax=Rhizoclosmatium globosum TaxID=329046 RepID=A0A1Y2CQ41_9FUNG|nr:hypothetical protein BCR33DRAFT_782195 [Rhizoclosmatium globosum]|eukprot:ORY48465.1 hypothetical protein BCR33DRAFT_782195 [Rhizoclosmatium globosum]
MTPPKRKLLIVLDLNGTLIDRLFKDLERVLANRNPLCPKEPDTTLNRNKLTAAMDIRDLVKHSHATAEVKAYCLYMYYFMGVKPSKLAQTFKKSKSTIQEWINTYETTGTLDCNLSETSPTLTLAEARYLFQQHYRNILISKSSICIILCEAGLSWKVIERRAMQVSEAEVV